jgi:hypothetical protein
MFDLPGPSRGSVKMLPKNGNFSGPGMLSICWKKYERSRLQYQTIRATKKNNRRFNMSNAITVKFAMFQFERRFNVFHVFHQFNVLLQEQEAIIGS